MPTDFEKDKKKVLNKLWSLIPRPLRPWVIMAAVGIPLLFGVIKLTGAEGRANQSAISDHQSGGMTANTVNAPTYNFYGQQESKVDPCRFFVEVLANVQELDKAIGTIDKPDFSINHYRFISDDNKRYDPKFGSPELDTQIKNFYTNLQKIPDGTYSKDMLLETRGQGQDVLNKLSTGYGCKDYFAGEANHAASGSTVQVRVGHAVSADASAVTVADYREADK